MVVNKFTKKNSYERCTFLEVVQLVVFVVQMPTLDDKYL